MSDRTIWDIATAIGTVGAVVFAVFSLWVPRMPWFKPKLLIGIHDDVGTRQPIFVGPHALETGIPNGEARYFHVSVKNKNRHAKATNVRVVVKKLEIEPEGGKRRVIFEYPAGVRLKWQHEHATGSDRTLGADDFADLFSLIHDPTNAERGIVRIDWTFMPAGVKQQFSGPCTIVYTVQAHSEEVSSTEMVVAVKWDGRYSTEGLTITCS